MSRRDRGFTLVEVLVALALISVLLGVTAGLVLASMNGFARGARQNEAKQLGLTIYEAVEARLSTATALGEGERSLESLGGRVLQGGTALYPETLYGALSAAFTVEAAGPSALRLTVTIYDETGAAFTKESAFRLLNEPEITLPEGAQNKVRYSD
jgi:prepilin-type N-terminal cleavage/methylation domain